MQHLRDKGSRGNRRSLVGLFQACFPPPSPAQPPDRYLIELRFGPGPGLPRNPVKHSKKVEVARPPCCKSRIGATLEFFASARALAKTSTTTQSRCTRRAGMAKGADIRPSGPADRRHRRMVFLALRAPACSCVRAAPPPCRPVLTCPALLPPGSGPRHYLSTASPTSIATERLSARRRPSPAIAVHRRPHGDLVYGPRPLRINADRSRRCRWRVPPSACSVRNLPWACAISRFRSADDPGAPPTPVPRSSRET